MVDNILILIGVFTLAAGIFAYFEMKGKPKNHHSEDGTNIGGVGHSERTNLFQNFSMTILINSISK